MAEENHKTKKSADENEQPDETLLNALDSLSDILGPEGRPENGSESGNRGFASSSDAEYTFGPGFPLESIPVLRDFVSEQELESASSPDTAASPPEQQLELYEDQHQKLPDELASDLMQKLSLQLSGMVRDAVNEAYDSAKQKAAVEMEDSLRSELEATLEGLIEEFTRDRTGNTN